MSVPPALIPEDEEDNHFIFPLFVREDTDGRDKAVYLSVPRDQTDAFANTMLRRLFKGAIETGQVDASEILADLRRETLGTWSPPIDIAVRWYEYGTNQMPVDSYFQRPIMSRDELEAAQAGHRGPALRKMASWTLGKFGAVGEVAKPAANRLLGAPYEEGPDTELESNLRSVPYLNVFLRISDRAVENDLYERAAEVDNESSVVRTYIDSKSKEVARRRSRIIRIPRNQRTEEDWRELNQTDLWNENVWGPYRKRIKLELDLDQPEEARKHAAHLKQITALFQRLWAAQRQGDEAAIEQAREQLNAWQPD